MNLVLPGGKYMQQSAEEFLVFIMNWLYNRNIISVQHSFVVMWVPFRMGKKWLQWSSTRSLLLWWFRSSCCNICMLRARLTSTATGGYFLSIKRCLKKHTASNKKVNQPGAYLLTYLPHYLQTSWRRSHIQTQSCKIQVRRNQTTSHVAWLTSNRTCWWSSSWWWWSCQVNEVAT